MWFDIDRMGASGGVSTLTDYSGNSNDLDQGTTPTITQNHLNGNDVLDFNGTSQYLYRSSVTELDNPTGIAIVCVSSLTDGSMAMVRYTGGGVVNNRAFALTESGTNFRYYAPAATTNTAIVTSSNSNDNIHVYTWDGASDTYSVYRNNSLTQTKTNATGTPSTNLSLYVGRNTYNSSGYMNGDMAEMMVYDTDLNAAQISIISNYLSTRYSISISNDKYGFDGTHGEDLAGIGQESAGENHTDARGASIVRINSADDLEDGEYLMWGHDGAGTGNGGTEIPSSYSASGLKLDQEWRADMSGGDGSVGDVDIIFDMSGIGFGADPDNYQIISDPDGDFSDGDETVHSITPTLNGNTVEFSGVTLNDGDYFTIANSNDIDDCASVTTNSWPSVVWSCGTTPDSTANVTISDGTTVTITGTQSAHELVVETDGGGGGGTLTLNANATLIVKADMTVQNGGTLTMGTGSTIIMRGSSAQSFSNASGSTLTLYNLEIDNTNGVTLETGEMELANGLTLTRGDLEIDVDFTFLSDASRTAHVTAIPNGSAITGTGNISVERYVGARTTNWNNIASSGVSTTIEDLDDEIYMSGIPGADGYAVAKGGGGFISIYSWNENGSPDAYVAPNSTGDQFEVGRGYEVWLGDNLTNWNAKAWTLTGSINLAATSLSVNSADSRWNLLGNPYPAFLDFDAIATASGGIDDDEYWYYNAGTSSFTSVSGASAYLPPGQGFWVQTTGISDIDIDPSTDFLSDENSSDFFKRSEKPELEVYVKSDDEPYASAVYVRRNESAFEGKDDLDVTPLRLPDPRACNLSMQLGADEIMVNYVPTHAPVLEFPMSMETGVPGDYTLSLKGLEYFKDYQCATVINENTGEQVFMTSESDYKFTVNDVADLTSLKLILSKEDNVNCESPADVLLSDENVHVWSNEKTIYADFYLDRGAQAEIEVFNVLGKRVYNNATTVSHTRERIDLSGAESGVYFVTISLNGSSTTDKIFLK